MRETKNQAAAEVLLRLAAHAVREAEGELSRDRSISTKEFNELTAPLDPGGLNDLADSMMLGNWRREELCAGCGETQADCSVSCDARRAGCWER